ncbi:MAG: MMPL family transporter [Gammaproteobacteria bacterium]|nr:MMPL family transporter [Gammaproteobacteria bacterium]
MLNSLKQIYEALVLGKPWLTLALLSILVAVVGYHSKDFRLDASADTLVLENDSALRYYRSISARYSSDDYLVITYTPNKGLFSKTVLADLAALRQQLAGIPRVQGVTTILDVPLINSPPLTLSELSKNIRTLESADVVPGLARKELTSSPFYSNLIISKDGHTTALQIKFKHNEQWHRLFNRRNALRVQELESTLTPELAIELKTVTDEFNEYSDSLREQERLDIQKIRSIMDKHRDTAKLFLGGVPMIVADSMGYVRSDLKTFGLAVLALLVIFLYTAFRKYHWVFLPVITCAVSGIFMLGLLGLLGWRVTVVSSNFISLLLIITMSLTVHLIVRYRELHANNPDKDQYWLVSETIHSKFLPSFYTAITTMVAFASLIFSDIRPVIDFGWMMVIGIAVAFFFTFTLFPAALVLLKPGKPGKLHDFTGTFTRYIANLIERRKLCVLLTALIMVMVSLVGISQLTVENSFISYFKSSTEIYQGMKLIDQELGGTTPLEIIVDAPKSYFIEVEEDTDIYVDDYVDSYPDQAEVGIAGSSFWFNSYMLEDVYKIHSYLDSLPETGKVLSISTAMLMLGSLKDGKNLDDFFLSILFKRLPAEVKDSLFTPYMSEDGNQLRFSIRVIDSDPDLKRAELLSRIEKHLIQDLGYQPEQIHLSGMLVLYNNMLQSLFSSQIKTLGLVFLAILLMFIVLFRSFKMAALAIIPNILSAATILGVMGLLGIPLDIMTITIAAITIGIAVDDTIHYVHRFQEEYSLDRNYWFAIMRCHNSIGRAMYYTSLIITIGFSILALSNFIPTIYFGLLTGAAMITALILNLTLLPLMIAVVRPMNKTETT